MESEGPEDPVGPVWQPSYYVTSQIDPQVKKRDQSCSKQSDKLMKKKHWIKKHKTPKEFGWLFDP